MMEHIAETICNYIKLAQKEIFKCMEHDLEEDDISIEGAEFIHYCLENIKHLKEMKAEIAEYHHDLHDDAVSAIQEKETDVHLHGGNIDIHTDKYSHTSALGMQADKNKSSYFG